MWTLLLHLGLSVRDTVCQPVHAWSACRAPSPTSNSPVSQKTWENPSLCDTVCSMWACQVICCLPTGLKAKMWWPVLPLSERVDPRKRQKLQSELKRPLVVQNQSYFDYQTHKQKNAVTVKEVSNDLWWNDWFSSFSKATKAKKKSVNPPVKLSQRPEKVNAT